MSLNYAESTIHIMKRYDIIVPDYVTVVRTAFCQSSNISKGAGCANFNSEPFDPFPLFFGTLMYTHSVHVVTGPTHVHHNGTMHINN